MWKINPPPHVVYCCLPETTTLSSYFHISLHLAMLLVLANGTRAFVVLADLESACMLGALGNSVGFNMLISLAQSASLLHS